MTLQALLLSKANCSSERSNNYNPNDQWRLSQILLSLQSFRTFLDFKIPGMWNEHLTTMLTNRFHFYYCRKTTISPASLPINFIFKTQTCWKRCTVVILCCTLHFLLSS